MWDGAFVISIPCRNRQIESEAGFMSDTHGVSKNQKGMTYAEMRAAGICLSCGKPNTTPEHSKCQACRDRQNEARRNNRAYLKRIGICVSCGRNKAEPNRVLCYECAGAKADAYMRRGRTDEQRENARNYKKIMAKKYLEDGKCPQCGKYPAVNGGSCKNCRARMKRYKDSHREDISRSERRSYGLCYLCGKNVIPEKGVCQSCYDVLLTRSIPAMQASQHSEYFRKLNNLVFRRQG